MRVEGTVCPLPTPTVRQKQSINEEALRKYTDFLVAGSVHGLFPCGSIGEFSSLSRKQQCRVIDIVSERAGDVPVLAGCGHTNVEGVRQNIEAAAAVGADAAVVVTPYYLSTTQSGLHTFFENVADDAALPIYLYNIPPLTGESLSIELVTALANHSNIVGLKDTSGNLTFLRNVVETTPESFCVLQGASELAVASLDLGADGIVAGPANVFPDAHSTLYDRYRSGKRDVSVELMNEVTNPVVSATRNLPTAAAIKHLVGLAGHDIGDPLPPLPQLSSSDRRSLEQCYESVRSSLADNPDR